jgi:hypothetical protein
MRHPRQRAKGAQMKASEIKPWNVIDVDCTVVDITQLGDFDLRAGSWVLPREMLRALFSSCGKRLRKLGVCAGSTHCIDHMLLFPDETVGHLRAIFG